LGEDPKVELIAALPAAEAAKAAFVEVDAEVALTHTAQLVDRAGAAQA